VYHVRMILLAGAALWAHPAIAADALKFGPPPAWVHAQPIPAAKASDAPISLLLNDQQIAFDHGKITTYNELAYKIENPQGLAAGNLSIVWQPATDTVIVNKVQIRRAGKVIDILANGQTFTVLRRETDLNAATLDGTLTGNLQPEGLQQGDIVDFATTTERTDPVLKGHVEAVFGGWNGLPVEAAHASLSWPSGVQVNVRESQSLPQPRRSTDGGTTKVEISAADVQPLVPPQGAPDRFKIGRIGEATDFASWADLTKLFTPLYRDASAIPASGPLHDEVGKIRASTSDPKRRAEQALALVQDRVRYVALEMGQGGYVPAPAETTWARRFGDCKGKTVLLLGILHSLGIEAEPVLVQSRLGDMIADRLPMVALFDHVLVRAHIGGKDYWLDGTRTGDTDLDQIKVPNFGWGLPLIHNAQLVRMVPAPLEAPSQEDRVNVDASAGVLTPSPTTIEEIYRGDDAVALDSLYSQLTVDQREEVFRKKAKGYFDSFSLSSSSFTFDKNKQELDLTMKGNAKLNWKDSWAYVPTSSIAFDPDFDRMEGPLHDVPWAVSHPRFVKDLAIIRLPAGFAAQQKRSAPVHETLAGVEYARTETIQGDVLTVESSERSLEPEIAYKDALAAAPRLKTLSNDNVYLQLPPGDRASANDSSGDPEQALDSAEAYITRGNDFLDTDNLDQAIADFSAALKLDPYNTLALADRGLAYTWKHDDQHAEADLKAVEAKDPTNAILLRARGVAADLKDDMASAIRYYTESLHSEPGSTFTLDHRGAAYYRNWQLDKAIRDFTEVLKKSSTNLMALTYRALAELKKGNYPAAEADAAAAKAGGPRNPTVLFLEAQLANHRGDYSAEIAADSKSIDVSPDKAAAYAARAEVYLTLRRYNDVLSDTDQALKLGYKSTDLHVARANAFMFLGNRDAVANEADAMIREAPDSDYALVGAAKTYAALGQRDKAMKAFSRALAITKSAIVYTNRADVRPFTDLDGRIADLNAALALEPNNVDVLSSMGRQLVLKRDYSGALKAYEKAAKLAPDDANVALGRALALYRSGRQKDAEEVIADRRSKAVTANDFSSICWAEGAGDMFVQQALSDCDRARTLDSKGSGSGAAIALLRLGRLNAAVREFNRSIAEYPNAFAYMGRAIAYARNGDTAHAKADLAEAQKLDPDEAINFKEFGLEFSDSEHAAKTVAR
jgi:tetratricopeptide (TPR) repeat protein